MPHKPFHLHKRKTVKGKPIFYCQFYDDCGRRMTAVSTGETSKSAAETWAVEQLKKSRIPLRRSLTFGKYAENWWIWDRCEYIRTRLALGKQISRSYTDTRRSYLIHHILPYFETVRLSKITAGMIEDWWLELKNKTRKNGKPLSAATVNRCLSTLKIMLSGAHRLGYLAENPADNVELFGEAGNGKGILTLAEVKALFDESKIETVWQGDIRHYTFNLVAASAGMRMGEIQALRFQDCGPDFIEVSRSWSRKYGPKEPKWNSARIVPIPKITSRCLSEIRLLSPYRENEDLIFFGKDRFKPMDHKLKKE